MQDLPFASDRPSDSDSFGRQQFAKSLANALLSVSTSDGFVIGIEGEWGTGKSTIISLAKAELLSMASDDAGPIIVEFNPWMIGGTNALVEALIVQIASAIGVQADAAGDGVKIGQKLLGYAGLLKHLKYLKYVPGTTFIGNIAEDVGTMAGAAAAAGEAVAESAGTAKAVLDNIKDVLPTLDLAKRKSEVAKGLRELNRPVVVIVDDIDRLTSDEIRTVVQAIKAVADFPRMTYLLAYDRKVVAKALGHEDESVGLSYLEKIVQIAYPIPPLFQYQLRAFVGTKLAELLRTLNITVRPFERDDLMRAVDLTARLVRHPRDVARLLNRLIVSLPATHTEVNIADVIVFEGISQRFPNIREMVHTHPKDFVGQIFRGDVSNDSDPYSWLDWAQAGDSKDKSPAWEKHLPESESDRHVATLACSFLFPGMRGGNRGAVAEDTLRLADPDRLARYFRMASLESVPEAKDVHRMLGDATKLIEELEGAGIDELAIHLEWLKNYAPSCVSPDLKGCVHALAKEASQRHGAHELTEDLAEAFEVLIERLIRLAPPESRAVIFDEAIRSAPLGIAEHLVLQAAAEQGKWMVRPDIKKPKSEQFIEEEKFVDEAIAAWSKRVREASDQDLLKNEPKLHSVLYRYAQLNRDYPATFAFVDRICASEVGLEAFVSCYRQGRAPYNIEEFGLVEDAKALADRVEASSSLAARYAWLLPILRLDENTKAIAERAQGHKALSKAEHVTDADGVVKS